MSMSIRDILYSDIPSTHLEVMRVNGKLEKYLPEVFNLIGCKQNAEFHPEGDVYTHTLMVIDEAVKVRHLVSNPFGFMLSALFHDIGKPASIDTDDNGKLTTHSHDEIGALMIEPILTRNITQDVNIIEYVMLMTKNHMRPRWLYPHASKKAFNKLKSEMGEHINDLFYLVEADTLGRGGVEPKEFDKYRNFFNQKMNELKPVTSKTKTDAIITSDVLIQFGFKPGRRFGQILKEMAEYQEQGYDKYQMMDILNTKKIGDN